MTLPILECLFMVQNILDCLRATLTILQRLLQNSFFLGSILTTLLMLELLHAIIFDMIHVH